MGIGDNLKTVRINRGMRQSELADALGVSDKTVSSWEINRTEPKMGMIEKICTVLNCKKTDIIGDSPNTTYYLNEETAQKAQEIFENKELSLLFDAARDASPEDIQTIHTMLLALKNKEKR